MRPLLPFARGTPARHQVLVRLGGATFTWLLLVVAAGLQFSREAEWSARLEVVDGLPAARARLRPGDVVVRVGSDEVSDFSELKDRLAFARRPRTLAVPRDSAELSFELSAPVLGITRSEERVPEPDRRAAWGRTLALTARAPLALGSEFPDGVVAPFVTAALAWVSALLEAAAFLVNHLGR